MKNHKNEFLAGEMKPATLKVKRAGRTERPHAGRAGQGGPAELGLGARLQAVFCREFLHELPMPREWWMLLAAAEWCLCSCVFWSYAMITCFTVFPVRGHMEYCCGASAWVAFGACWLFPLALLLSGWRRSFAAARCLLLAVGGLCVASALVNLVVGGLSSAPICMLAYLGRPAGELPLMMAVFPLLLLGAGCLLRACCGRHYGHCFYAGALIRSWQRGRLACGVLVVILALYGCAYLF